MAKRGAYSRRSTEISRDEMRELRRNRDGIQDDITQSSIRRECDSFWEKRGMRDPGAYFNDNNKVEDFY